MMKSEDKKRKIKKPFIPELPFYISPLNALGEVEIRDKRGKLIVKINGRQAEDNAIFIAMACNNFQRLINVCGIALELISSMKKWVIFSPVLELNKTEEKIKNVIAKIREIPSKKAIKRG